MLGSNLSFSPMTVFIFSFSSFEKKFKLLHKGISVL